MLRLKLWAVFIAGTILLQYTEAGPHDTQDLDGPIKDVPFSEDLNQVLRTLRGPTYQIRRGRSFNYQRARTAIQDKTSRSFVTRLMDELSRITGVGINWFAQDPQVSPVECSATNGALDVGTCFSESSCDSSGGVASGVCPSGGVCCIFPTVCGGTVTRNRTWFVNKDFPDYTREPSSCQLTIKRADTTIKQVRLDFVVSELGDAVQGQCKNDALTVQRAGGTEDLIPSLCGDNSGQHVYVDFAYQELRLNINTDTTLRRKWHVLISQVAPGQEVPNGCLQFYSDRAATVKSLNYKSGSYLFKGDLDYDICFPALEKSSGGQTCHRRAEDIDLRQSENDVRTRRGKWAAQSRHMGRNGRRGRSSRLPIVMAFNKNLQSEDFRPRTLQSNLRRTPVQSFPRSRVYSLVRDPVYSQIDDVMSQLKSPANTGLESLLNSKSQLDEMKEKFNEKEEPNEEAYYYYYYDDDAGDLQRNDLEESPSKPATDNYAVEHAHREFVVLPDGTPIQGNFFVHNPANKANQEQSEYTTDMYNSDKYFHTGMLEDIKEVTQEEQAGTPYPTPTYFQRPTSPPQNQIKPDHRVASIMVFDPHSSPAVEETVRYQDTSNDQQRSTVASDDSPSHFGLEDLTSLSTINPDAEYTLKHDGVQWLFLKNDKSTKSPTVLSSTSKVILPHEINISPGAPPTAETAAGKPHLVFKHPSGTVTEMHITAGDGHNPDEKIVTIIETGPITQNFTKIKISDITELDKVIENIFDIVSESSENTDSQVSNLISQTPSSLTTYPQTSFTTFPDTTMNTQSPQETTYFAHANNDGGSSDDKIVVVTHPNDHGIVKNDHKLSEGYMTANEIDEQHFTTVVDSTNRYTSTPLNIRFTNTPTRFVHQISKRPEKITTEGERTTVTFAAPSPAVPTNRPILRITNPALNTSPGVTRFTYSTDVTRPIRHHGIVGGATRHPGTSTRIRVVPHGTRFSSTVEQVSGTTPLRVTTESSYTLTTNPEGQPQKIVYTTRLRPQTHTPTFTVKRNPTSEVPAASSLPTTLTQFLIPNKRTEVFSTVRGDGTRPTLTTVQMNSATDEIETQPPTAATKPSTFATVTETDVTTDPFAVLLNNLGVKTATTLSPTQTTKPLFKISTTTDGVVSTKNYFTVEDALADLAKITTNVIEDTASTESTVTKSHTVRLTTKPYASTKPSQSATVASLQNIINLEELVTEGDVDELAIFNNEACENSYLKVNNVRLCDRLLRSEIVRNEAERLFTDMERISIRSVGATNDPLRFSLKYEMVCPAEVEGEGTTPPASVRIAGVTTPGVSSTRTPQVKTVNLLQYLLGWYRR